MLRLNILTATKECQYPKYKNQHIFGTISIDEKIIPMPGRSPFLAVAPFPIATAGVEIIEFKTSVLGGGFSKEALLRQSPPPPSPGILTVRPGRKGRSAAVTCIGPVEWYTSKSLVYVLSNNTTTTEYYYHTRTSP